MRSLVSKFGLNLQFKITIKASGLAGLIRMKLSICRIHFQIIK